MGMEIGGAWVRKQSLDEAADPRFIRHIGVDHHVALVESPDRQKAARQGRRNLILEPGCLPGRLPDKDRMPRPIGCCGRLMFEIQQQNGLARSGIVQCDAAGKARAGVNPVAEGLTLEESFIRQGEQRLEVGNGQT
jgi:hypothetical protein